MSATLWIIAAAAGIAVLGALALVWAIATGRLMVASLDRDGAASGKCPECGRPVAVGPFRARERAFRCEHCGAEAEWL